MNQRQNHQSVRSSFKQSWLPTRFLSLLSAYLIILSIVACSQTQTATSVDGDSGEETPLSPMATETEQPSSTPTNITVTQAPVATDTPIPVATETPSPVVTATPPVTPTIVPTATEEPVDEGQMLMNQLVAQTRHWKGNADAPVTFLEFSDFK